MTQDDLSGWGPAKRRRERDLLDERAALDPADPRARAVRDELVTMHLPLVRHLANRYRGRGESMDDLVQVGTEGLIKAVDRFDPHRGTDLSSLAVPTILGEIRRHFRDRTWAAHVPRRTQELQARLLSQSDTLTQVLGRSPTVRELAAALGADEDDVLEALEARHARSAESIDGTAPDRGPLEALAERDTAMDAVEERETLRPLLAALPDRERAIIVQRFFHDRSQAQIAKDLGISQMHVSRLLARTLTRLREQLTDAS